MPLQPPIFADVPLHTSNPAPCSPEPPGPEWRGILIAAPERVTMDRTGVALHPPAPIPICGYYLLDVPREPTEEAIWLVLTEPATETTREAPVTSQDPSPVAPPPERSLDPALLEGVASGSYFNPDLTTFLPLPPVAATYEVTVRYRGFTSNTVTIDVVAPEE
jgi:hypothetical protein